MSEFVDKNRNTLIAVIIPAILSLCGWLGNNIIEGAEHKGYNRAKEETNEEYNQALRDAIIYRAKWESCCAEQR